MGRSVEFNPGKFRELFPQYSEALFTEAQLTEAFRQACLVVDNRPEGMIPYAPESGIDEREVVLNLLVGHICAMSLRGREGQSGPLTSAAEGSVKASFAVPAIDRYGYFVQTPLGQTFWQATAKYRVGGRYVDVNERHHP